MANGWHRKRTDTPAEKRRTKDYNSAAHKAARKAGADLVASGRAHCWRCARHIPPGTPWHVGHDDHDRSIIRGVECVPCNLKAAARKGARLVNARRRQTRLRW